MNSHEFNQYTLAIAVEKDEIGKAELVRYLNELVAISAEFPDTEASQDLCERLHKRFDAMMTGEGE